jgi:hypothetical protein
LRKIGKIVYSNKIIVKVSLRRFKKYGILKVIKEWIKGDIMVFMGKKPYAKYHKEIY